MGWPKLVLKLEGPDSLGKNIVKGYATCSIPVAPGQHNIECHIFRPIQPSYIGLFFGSQKKPANMEADEELIATGEGREVSSVENMGTMKITVQVSLKNFSKLGYVI